MVDIIKSFAFYDTITAQARKQKALSVGDIKTAEWSRCAMNIEDTDGKWVFWNEKDIRTQMQGFNCCMCGNYRVVQYLEDVLEPERIMCHCIQE
jgi:hypothetical protein